VERLGLIELTEWTLPSGRGRARPVGGAWRRCSRWPATPDPWPGTGGSGGAGGNLV